MECHFGRGSEWSDRVSAEYIRINNFGYYKNLASDISISRMNGRTDYQLIYIEKGRGSFFADDRAHTCAAGSVVIYRPGEKQVYTFEAGDDTAYYWIHFTGTGVCELLCRLRLKEHVFHTGELYGFRDKLEKMTDACRIEDFTTEDCLAGIFISVLSEAAKKLHITDSSMLRVIEAMQRDTAYKKNNSDYAAMYGISEYHFIRKFRDYTGMSPHRYKTKLLMDKASDLLVKTDLNVSEVAELLGYTDSLHFSRVFKKYAGISPKKYASNAHFKRNDAKK